MTLTGTRQIEIAPGAATHFLLLAATPCPRVFRRRRWKRLAAGGCRRSRFRALQPWKTASGCGETSGPRTRPGAQGRRRKHAARRTLGRPTTPPLQLRCNTAWAKAPAPSRHKSWRPPFPMLVGGCACVCGGARARGPAANRKPHSVGERASLHATAVKTRSPPQVAQSATWGNGSVQVAAGLANIGPQRESHRAGSCRARLTKFGARPALGRARNQNRPHFGQHRAALVRIWVNRGQHRAKYPEIMP